MARYIPCLLVCPQIIVAQIEREKKKETSWLVDEANIPILSSIFAVILWSESLVLFYSMREIESKSAVD
jgi:hypothetical protein